MNAADLPKPRPVIGWPGGKTRLLKELLPLIPEHTLYCEVFGGGLALLLTKEESEVEVINDINGDLISFYRTCKYHLDPLLDEPTTQGKNRSGPYWANLVNLAVCRLRFHLTTEQTLNVLEQAPAMRFWTPETTFDSRARAATRKQEAASVFFKECFPELEGFTSREYWKSYPQRSAIRKGVTAKVSDLP